MASVDTVEVRITDDVCVASRDSVELARSLLSWLEEDRWFQN